MHNTSHTADLNDEQLLRYSRQIMLPQFGIEAQQKLLSSHAVIIGIGGLGSPAALYLAAAGVGQLTLVDHDQVEISNLQRQIIHTTENIGQHKVHSAKAQLAAINPDIVVHTINKEIDEEKLSDLLSHVDCVLDATDNFSSRFLINRLCVQHKTPLISAAAIGFEGQISVFDSRQSDNPCYACLYPEQGEENTTCSENGILAPVVGIMGCMQALEAIKLLTSTGETLVGQLQLFDAINMQWRNLKFKQDPACPVCSNTRHSQKNCG